jgi:hypothetical protein
LRSIASSTLSRSNEVQARCCEMKPANGVRGYGAPDFGLEPRGVVLRAGDADLQ